MASRTSRHSRHSHQHRRHQEGHFRGNARVRDLVIGMADGLTVPFALAAGLSGAAASSHIVVTAGLAEIAAGSIAMGVGGYLAAKGDADHYASERQREVTETIEIPAEEEHEVIEALGTFGVRPEECAGVVAALRRQPEKWVDFMMRFELGLEAPEPHGAAASALTIAGSYVAGGIVPLLPYFVFPSPALALGWSAGVALVALFAFGFVKGRLTGTAAGRSALQTTVIGALAAGVAFLLAKAVA